MSEQLLLLDSALRPAVRIGDCDTSRVAAEVAGRSKQRLAVLNALPERIRKKIAPSDTCWLWIGGKTAAGYGHMWNGTSVVYAHRYLYEHFVGPIPSGTEIDHLCRVKACVNPAHLEPVPHAENSRRAVQWEAVRCKAGHARSPENTYITARGRQVCRVCQCESAHRGYWADPDKFRARRRKQREKDRPKGTPCCSICDRHFETWQGLGSHIRHKHEGGNCR